MLCLSRLAYARNHGVTSDDATSVFLDSLAYTFADLNRSVEEFAGGQTMKHASLAIAQAKKALAATYEVEEEAIEITIRG